MYTDEKSQLSMHAITGLYYCRLREFCKSGQASPPARTKQSCGITLGFSQVNADFSCLMEDIFQNPNAIRACCTDPQMVERVTGMDTNLEQIQKSLDQYLETKR